MILCCQTCGQTKKVNPRAIAACRRAGLPYPCPCGGHMEPGERESGRTDSQKRSRAQEKRAAKRMGGKVQPASGATGAKGDVRDPGRTRMECKLTRNASYSLKLADLQKIESEVTAGEHPVFEVEFQGVYPHKRYVVIPGWLYDHYANLEEVTRAL